VLSYQRFANVCECMRIDASGSLSRSVRAHSVAKMYYAFVSVAAKRAAQPRYGAPYRSS
jgi:hypothetical protein